MKKYIRRRARFRHALLEVLGKIRDDAGIADLGEALEVIRRRLITLEGSYDGELSSAFLEATGAVQRRPATGRSVILPPQRA